MSLHYSSVFPGRFIDCSSMAS